MNNPLDIMYAEHEVVMKAEKIVDGLKGLWETDPSRFESTARQLVGFFREYADGYHHRKEEEILFPAIMDHPDFVLHGIIEEFETHHEDFREYAREIMEALDDKDYPRAMKVLERYTGDLLDHIAAENDELFVLAENLLDPQLLETLYFKFQDVDMELGQERKAAFEAMIDKLME
ncbi:MAG: hemerythrin domain-containing protein [Bacteroidetes bacterium]|nr:hemerythrin domain-containing protein [Bacteroidota bacterium]